MNTTNPTQTSSTSHWPKRSGFIHLALLVLLSVFMVPQHGIAQQDIQLEFKKVLTPSQFNSAIESMDGGPSTKSLKINSALIATRWVKVFATPNWVSASMGGRVYLQGQLQYKSKNGTYVPLPGQTVYFVDFANRVYKYKTNNQGFVEARMKITPFYIQRSVAISFAWVYKPTSTFASSSGQWFFTLGQ